MSKTTPRPWTTTKEFGDTLICSEPFEDKLDGQHIATMRVGNEANAVHIVKCVNMHDELVTALKVALEYARANDGDSVCLELELALAKAEGGTK